MLDDKFFNGVVVMRRDIPRQDQGSEPLVLLAMCGAFEEVPLFQQPMGGRFQNGDIPSRR